MKTQATTTSEATPKGAGPKTAAPTATVNSSADAALSPGKPTGLLDVFFTHLNNFFTSLKLTVVCLVFGIVLVFWGTLAQVDLGLFKAQNEFFRSFFIFWSPKGADVKVPIFPGGYLVGGVLLINLVASHFRRFKLSRDKVGIWMVHVGLILLLVGQLGTDMLSRETAMHLREGETKNYSEADRTVELAIIDTTDKDLDKVVAIPQSVLARQSEVRHAELPFTVRIKKWYGNSLVESRPVDAATPPPATQGVGSRAAVRELAHVTEMNRRDVPTVIAEIVTPQGSLGSWLASEYVSGSQVFTYANRNYQMILRLGRHYKPYSLKLLQFRHDLYPGTDIPKNFSSKVLLERPDTGESREVLIYMNSPLRYSGETYYQSGFDEDNRGTILQVVHNPSWLTPYFSCLLVGLGLLVHFAMHLLGFTFKKKTV